MSSRSVYAKLGVFSRLSFETTLLLIVWQQLLLERLTLAKGDVVLRLTFRNLAKAISSKLLHAFSYHFTGIFDDFQRGLGAAALLNAWIKKYAYTYIYISNWH